MYGRFMLSLMKVPIPKYIINYIKNINDLYNTEYKIKFIDKKEYTFRKIKKYIEINGYYFEEIKNKIVFQDGYIDKVRIIKRDISSGKVKIITIKDFNIIVLMDKYLDNNEIKYRFKAVFLKGY